MEAQPGGAEGPGERIQFQGRRAGDALGMRDGKGSDSSNGIEIQSLGEILDSGAWAAYAHASGNR